MIINIKPYGFIYVLTNKNNGKKYIGQTKNIIRRINEYKTRKVFSNKKYNYTIMRIINKIGFHNFSFEVIDDAFSKKELSRKEKYYILYFNTTNPEFGYNSRLGDLKGCLNQTTKELMSKSHKGLKETGITKKKKSKRVIVFRDNNCYICDSGKLFGNFIGKGRDIISHFILNGYRVCGWYVFRLDDNIDRSYLYENLMDKNYIKLYKLVEMGLETIESLYQVKYIEYK